MNIEITVAEYFEQLELMKKQYGQEEDLYPYIYMLLIEAGLANRYSIRSVAGAQNTKEVKGRELLMGYAAFPDIVILDTTFLDNKSWKYRYDKEINKLYCCVEVKKLVETLFNIEGKVQIKTSSTVCVKASIKAKTRYYKAPDNIIEDFIEEYGSTLLEINNYGIFKIELGNGGGIKKREQVVDLIVNYENNENDRNYIVIKMGETEALRFSYDKGEAEDWGEPVTTVSNPPKLVEILEREKFYLLVDKCRAIASIGNENIELTTTDGTVTHGGEVIGELLWYGSVIYTNGKEWKYLKIESIKESNKTIDIVELRRMLYDSCVKYKQKDGERHKWCQEISNRGISFEVKEEKLMKIYDKDGYTMIKTESGESKIDDEDAAESKWQEFRDGLAKICEGLIKCKDAHKE